MASRINGWGGVRLHAGRLKRNINLSPEAARELSILVKQRHSTEKQIVEGLIHGAWQESGEQYQQVSESAS